MSCLFNSLSHFVPQSSFDIRQRICDYLQQNQPVIEGLDTSFILQLDTPNYIGHMRNMSTWGGAIEIQAACNIWNLRIVVHNHRGGQNSVIEFIPLHGNVERSISLQWTGGHYEPMR